MDLDRSRSALRHRLRGDLAALPPLRATRRGLKHFVTLALLGWAAGAHASTASLVDAVNPFIGTDAHGHTYPGATAPFGMVQLSPDTRLAGWDGCSGYHFSDEVVYGFSHTHLSGTGVSDYGDVLFMPVVGEVSLRNGSRGGPDQGYASRFDKSSEVASPGYYSVHLSDYDVEVELTATERAGLHRYRFPTGKPAHVVLDLTHRDTVLDSRIEIVGDDEVVGFRRSSAWATDQVVYFCAKFSRPFRARLAEADTLREGATRVSGTNTKAIFDFGRGGSEVMIRVGISAVDVDGTRRNAESEIPHFDFPAVRARTREAWSRALDRFTVEGASDEERTVFATALYHSFLAPNLFSDVDGRYRGMDGEIHRADGRDHYTVFSLWDTYRATHPLFTLVERERTKDFVRTMLAQYREGGRLPVWELAANETDCMIGYHAVSVISDAFAKGITDFDAELALEAMLDAANRDLFELDAYRRQGFISTEDEAESVSRTAEYAYDDWCIARFAERVGRDDVAREFDRRSQAWRHLFDPRTKFLRPRANGGWLTPYDPRRVDFHHTEANGWQYRFAVQHDVEGLIEAFGGDALFSAAVDSMFSITTETTGRVQSDITGLIGQYAHGNEPSHHVAWLHHFAGRPDRSAALVDRIRREFYTAEPDGLIGNEDCGQMSSWYVFAAMGLYPVTPGTDEYVIVPPQFASVAVTLEDGARFTVRREGEGGFVQSARLNGVDLPRSFLRQDEILAGGELVLTVGDEASSWGRAPAQRPHSGVSGERIAPAPWIEAPSETFRDSMIVRVGAADPRARLFIAVESVESGITRNDLTGPTLVLHESAVVRARAAIGAVSSPVVTARFTRIDHDWTVSVEHPPSPQYTAGGPNALIDGLRGSTAWRTGKWHGYDGVDLVATVDLGELRRVQRVGAGFLQDTRSWIVLPTELTVEASEDGRSFVEIARVGHDIPARRMGSFVLDLAADVEARARFLRFHAKNFGELPSWHLGAGGQAFVFVDELLIDSIPVE